MKNLQQKKNLFLKKISFYTLIGSFALGTISYLPIFETKNFQTNVKYHANQSWIHANNITNLTNQVLVKSNNSQRPEISKDIYGVKISEKSLVKNHPLENTEFFLGHQGLELLIDKIKTRTAIGPEFFDVSEIILTQSSPLISEFTNGWYNPLTHQIVLNFSPMLDYFKHNWTNRVQYLDDITESLYQVFYHEYGHHVFNVYLTNYDADKNLNNDLFVKLYRGSLYGRFSEPWNRNFIDGFKTNLDYDKNTPLLEDSFIKNTQGKTIVLKNGLKLKSVASLYNAKMLFELANQEEYHHYQELDQAETLSHQTLYTWASQTSNRTSWSRVNGDSLRYLYQITELLTRKYMQLTFPFKTTRLITSNGMFNPLFKAPFSTTYLEDARKYQEELNSTDQQRFLNDAPFKDNKTADNLMDLLNLHIGQKRSENISFIWNYSDVKTIEKGDKTQYQVNGLDVNKIKFGGFLTAAQEHYQYIGYFDQQHFRAIPITVYNYDLNRLPYLGASQRLSLKDGAKKFYVTNYNYSNDWIDINRLDNQQLFFATDNLGNNATPLKSNREIAVNAPVWTKRYHNIYEANQQNFYAMVSADNYSLKINKQLANF